ncbi:hypothetical protein J4221_02450 [Candidatus Pacearchaeota archaeon]|nr:hypothetical protein [Candidatus Pacearchaeota archaeon]
MKSIGLLLALLMMVSLFGTSFVNAGWWNRGVSHKSMSFQNPHRNNLIVDFNKKFSLEKQHSKSVDERFSFKYKLDYYDKFENGNYGFDRFRFYDNGYDHEYKQATYGYHQRKVSVEVEEKKSVESQERFKFIQEESNLQNVKTRY